ncbi:hypothetical protein [Azospirillum soli]|uniref:hypothetical protein n=1 Tax=Azospirillum soli TaxID=1304799 RepID=UPI001AE3324A|nr:hypothetical protein [Azospirillum soli]MBP2313454.1 hypothetical protein [Azospirillum soli]
MADNRLNGNGMKPQSSTAIVAGREIILQTDDLTERQRASLEARLPLLRRITGDADDYLARNDADRSVFGSHWGGPYFSNIARRICEPDWTFLERLRLVYEFSGLPIVTFRRQETAPVVDPVLNRYMKLRAITPANLRFSAPPMCGEAGWKIDRGIVNWDVAIVQERLQFLHFSGVLDWLNSRPHRPTIMEIGTGCGLFALALGRVIPEATYILCDVPDVLLNAAAYLAMARPAARYHVVLPDGIHSITAEGEHTILSSLDEVHGGYVFMPNYMMHRYGPSITLDMGLNAMSMHEMAVEQIAYYAGLLSRATGAREGLYFDINTYYKGTNEILEFHFNRAFAVSARPDLIDLALSPKIWTNSRRTMTAVEDRMRHYRSLYDLDAAFSIDFPFEYPPFDENIALGLLNEEIGSILNVDYQKVAKERGKVSFNDDLKVFFGEHLAIYRARFGVR